MGNIIYYLKRFNDKEQKILYNGSMGQTFLIEFGIILIVASALGIIAKVFRQPLILAYLAAGVLIGPLAFGVVKDQQIIETFATIGIIFLLFLIGLELNPKKLLEVGLSATIIGLGQIFLSGLVYYIIASLFGLSGIGGFYLALAFSFCSTAIIVTILSSRKELDSLQGKVIVGVLLVQDFVAILLLTMIGTLKVDASGLLAAIIVGKTIIRAALLFGFSAFVSRYILPPAFAKIAKSHELLFITSLAWCFILVMIAISLGFSPEIGAFLAGVTIAPLPYAPHIGAKTSPLRDFFIMIFFIYLGTNLIFENMSKMIVPAIVFSLLILIVNPLIVMLIMGALGFRKRTSFLTGITLTQISEFSFIVAIMGAKLKILPPEATTLTSMVAIITVFFSSYLISRSREIYHFARPYLDFIESNNRRDALVNIEGQIKNHTILIGCNRIGGGILKTLKTIGEQTIVVDYDPKRIQQMIDAGENCIYGDAADHDIVKDLNLEKAKTVISTIENIEESKMILSIYKKINSKLTIILIAQDEDEAAELYGLGADLVIVPTAISSDFISYTLERMADKKTSIEELKKKSIEAMSKGQIATIEKKFVKTIVD